VIVCKEDGGETSFEKISILKLPMMKKRSPEPSRYRRCETGTSGSEPFGFTALWNINREIALHDI
jgi:hypothetical protein